MKLKWLLFALLIGVCFPALAQRTEKNAQVVMNDGVVYSLPRTGVRIYVTAVREKLYAGPYAQFAEAMLGLKNAPTSDAEHWTITGVRIETFSEADPQQVFKAKGMVGSMLNLTPAGVLAGVNSKAETTLAAPVYSSFADNMIEPEYPFTDLSLNPFFVKQDSTKRNVIIAKTLQEKAMEAANTVTKLRKRRFKTLANGYDEQLPDGQAYEVMVDELDKLEKDYVALFVGKTVTNTYNYSFDFVPGDNSVSGEVVFRFSDTKGVLPKTDLSGKPVQFDLKRLDDLASAQQGQKGSSSAQSGLFYRLPGKGELRVMNGLSLLAMARLDVAQFGTVMPFPDELLDGNHQIQVHPETGAIKSITVK